MRVGTDPRDTQQGDTRRRAPIYTQGFFMLNTRGTLERWAGNPLTVVGDTSTSCAHLPVQVVNFMGWCSPIPIRAGSNP